MTAVAAEHADAPVAVGRVGRSHGLDGSFVVEGASETAERFAVGAVLRVGGRPVRILASKHSGGRRVVRLDGPAERGETLEVRRSELPPLAKDRFYVDELVGLAVIEEGGRPLGRVAAVAPGVANDVLELDGVHSLPLVGACVLEVDLAGGRIVVASGFVAPD